jgi:hypothetical protein
MQRGRLLRSSKLSPVGTAESSPGRQSWVFIPTETNPAGTTENVPERQSWETLTLQSPANPGLPSLCRNSKIDLESDPGPEGR